MKTLFYPIFLCFIACSDKSKPKEAARFDLSSSQKGIQNMVDSFKSEYKTANSELLRDSVINKHNAKLFDYLSNTNLDSIKVHIDEIVINDLTVATKFHCNEDIAFQYNLKFTEPMTKFSDSLFRFMTGLKVGEDTTINFSYMGSHQLSDPRDNFSYTLKISAIPSFLKGRR